MRFSFSFFGATLIISMAYYGYIESGKKDGATLHQGGDRSGTEGYFINPSTIFTDGMIDFFHFRFTLFIGNG